MFSIYTFVLAFIRVCVALTGASDSSRSAIRPVSTKCWRNRCTNSMAKRYVYTFGSAGFLFVQRLLLYSRVPFFSLFFFSRKKGLVGMSVKVFMAWHMKWGDTGSPLPHPNGTRTFESLDDSAGFSGLRGQFDKLLSPSTSLKITLVHFQWD